MFSLQMKRVFAIVAFLIACLSLLGCDGGLPTEYIDNFIKAHPSCKVSDGYCTVAWGGDNPNGGTYFRLTNNTDEKRTVEFEFWLRNNSSFGKTSHEEFHVPSFSLKPHETRDVCVPWTQYATNQGKRPLVSFDSHGTDLRKVTSTIDN